MAANDRIFSLIKVFLPELICIIFTLTPTVPAQRAVNIFIQTIAPATRLDFTECRLSYACQWSSIFAVSYHGTTVNGRRKNRSLWKLCLRAVSSESKRRKSRWVNGNPKREARKPCDAFCIANWSADKGQEVMVLVMGRRKFYYLSLFIRHIRSLLIFSFFETIFFRNSTVISESTFTVNVPPVSSLKFRAIFWGESSIFFFNSIQFTSLKSLIHCSYTSRWARVEYFRTLTIGGTPYDRFIWREALGIENYCTRSKITREHFFTSEQFQFRTLVNLRERSPLGSETTWNETSLNKLATNLKFLFRNEDLI